MKRVFCLLAALMLAASLCACGDAVTPESETTAITTEPSTTTEMPTTTAPALTLSPVVEEFDYWVDGYPILKEAADSYDEILFYFGKIQAGLIQEGQQYTWVRYFLYDLDGDFTPELFVYLIGNYPRGQWHVYTMQNGKALYVGMFDAMFVEMFSCSKGGIYLRYLRKTSHALYRITKKGNQLRQEKIFDREKDGDNWSPWMPSPDNIYLDQLLYKEFEDYYYRYPTEEQIN